MVGCFFSKSSLQKTTRRRRREHKKVYTRITFPHPLSGNFLPANLPRQRSSRVRMVASSWSVGLVPTDVFPSISSDVCWYVFHSFVWLYFLCVKCGKVLLSIEYSLDYDLCVCVCVGDADEGYFVFEESTCLRRIVLPSASQTGANQRPSLPCPWRDVDGRYSRLFEQMREVIWPGRRHCGIPIEHSFAIRRSSSWWWRRWWGQGLRTKPSKPRRVSGYA